MNHTPFHQLAENLLGFLRDNHGTYFSPESLADTFSVSADAVLSAIAVAESWGYRFTYSGTKICFQHAPDLLTDTELQYGLSTKYVGQVIYAYQQVKSTNDIARELAEDGAVEGTIVTAEEQIQGRGRLGRQWHSPSGKGAYLSMVLRPGFPPEQAPGMSLATALALAEAITMYCPEGVQIKWPNDIQIYYKKVAGILIELSAERTTINYLIVGVGININHTIDNFPPELQKIATSVAIAKGETIRRVPLVQRFLTVFEQIYEQYARSGLQDFLPQLRNYSSLLGKQVTLKVGNKTLTGIARDINPDGALMVECENRLVPVSSGEVTVVRC